MKQRSLSVLGLLTVILLLVSSVSVAAEPAASVTTAENVGTAIHNERFSMEVDPSTGFFTVIDSVTGMTYTSNPPDFQQDTVSQGYGASRLASQISVTFLNENKATDQVNSYVGSVSESGLQVTRRGDTLVCTYTFPQQGFVIPLECSLTDTSLKVSIDYEHVQETTGCRIMDITLLPYFGAAREGDKGCLVIPDGSGAYIGFHNGRFAQGDYVREVYSGDLTKTSETKPNDYKPVLLPMFASLFEHVAPLLSAPDVTEAQVTSKTGTGRDVQAGFVAAIQSGAAGSYLTASVAGYDTGYDTAYFSFLYRTGIETSFLSRTWAEIKRMMLAEEACLPENPQVEYRFLSGEQATIRGAAEVYASMLFSESASATSQSVGLHLDLIAGVRTQQQFLGFGYQGITPLTTLDQTEEILQYFQENGVEDLLVRLRGLDSSGAYYGSIDNKLLVNRRIGNLNQLKKMMETWEGLYPEVQLTQFTRNGAGVWSFFDSVTAVNKKTTKLFDYHYATGMRNYDLPTRYLLRPDKVARVAEKLRANLEKQGIGHLAPTSLAMDLYSNYSGEDYSLGEVEQLFAEQIAQLASGCELLLEAPNAYAMPYAKAILALPHTHSGHFICDGAIPFVQMVLDGRRGYSVPAVNYAADPQIMLLHALESNSSLSYSVMAASYDAVARTSLNDQYASTLSQWKEEIVKKTHEVASVRQRTGNSTITNYDFVDKDVRIVTFANGVRLLINYGASPRTLGAETIPAASYILLEGGTT